MVLVSVERPMRGTFSHLHGARHADQAGVAAGHRAQGLLRQSEDLREELRQKQAGEADIEAKRRLKGGFGSFLRKNACRMVGEMSMQCHGNVA